MVCDWDYTDVLKILCDTMDSEMEKAKQAGGAKPRKSPMKMLNKYGLNPLELAYEENT